MSDSIINPRDLTPEQIAATIDHTLLKADATAEQVHALCREASANNFASVCVNPVWVDLAAKELADAQACVCTVVGFPLGASDTAIKVAETRYAIEHGASEIDMVIPVGRIAEDDGEPVLQDICEVTRACHELGAICKVIIEAALLTDEEKGLACMLSLKAGADFVKTSTGFGPGGATVEDVRLMSAAVSDAGLGVKAAGGIRTYEDTLAMLAAGATRIGASAGLAILAEARKG
ncbi:MAG: deoxyribose-phosphate aldolase [bacterium]|nr:deoxyribose-phosphate aldolase [bacterium]